MTEKADRLAEELHSILLHDDEAAPVTAEAEVLSVRWHGWLEKALEFLGSARFAQLLALGANLVRGGEPEAAPAGADPAYVPGEGERIHDCLRDAHQAAAALRAGGGGVWSRELSILITDIERAIALVKFYGLDTVLIVEEPAQNTERGAA
jgi:hypothetical protein